MRRIFSLFFVFVIILSSVLFSQTTCNSLSYETVNSFHETSTNAVGWNAQSFKINFGFTLDSVGVNISRVLGNPGEIIISIFSDNNNTPEELLSESTPVASSVGWAILALNTPLEIEANTTYHIVIHSTNGTDNFQDSYELVHDLEGGYECGFNQYSYDSGSSWGQRPETDLNFRLIGTFQNSLVAYYPFNSNAFDESGYENNGTVNGAQLTTDRFGNENSAYEFDGENDYLKVPHSESLNIQGTISFGGWFYFDSVEAGYQTLISKTQSSNFALHLNHATYPNKISAWLDIGGSYKTASFDTEVLNNEWNFIFCTYDQQYIRLFLNGIIQDSVECTGNITTNSTPLIIGAEASGEGGAENGTYFNGKIDDVRIYNYAINQITIDSLYNENINNDNVFLSSYDCEWKSLGFDVGEFDRSAFNTEGWNDVTPGSQIWDSEGKQLAVFTKEFNISSLPDSATLNVNADNVYMVIINDHMMGEDNLDGGGVYSGVRGSFTTETFDITNDLIEGTNKIFVIAVDLGDYGWLEINMQADGQTILSGMDTDWKSKSFEIGEFHRTFDNSWWNTAANPYNNSVLNMIGIDNSKVCWDPSGEELTVYTKIFNISELSSNVTLRITSDNLYLVILNDEGMQEHGSIGGTVIGGTRWITIDEYDVTQALIIGENKLMIVALDTGDQEGLFFEFSGDATITDVNEDLLKVYNYELCQNFPNPFNPSTTISYSIPNREFVELKVYDILGKEIVTLVSEEKPAGKYQIKFNTNHLASGVYFYTLRAGDFVKTRKMVLLK